jgi:signal peptidase I
MEVETTNKGISGWIQAIAIGRRPKRTMVRLGLLIGLGAIAALIFNFVLLPVRITGPSMEPTYDNGSINFINCLAYLRHEPQRGDVVGIRFSGNHTMLVKRIVGLPGETMQFSHGKVLIDGQELVEPYLKLANKFWDSPPKLLGPQEYYVVGDNRSMPIEDHTKGAAERNRIVGKIWLRSAS